MLGLHCFSGFFPLVAVRRGFSLVVVCGLLLLWLLDSRAQAQYLCLRDLVPPQHVASSWTRNRTRVSCTGRRILYHWATREALPLTLLIKPPSSDLSSVWIRLNFHIGHFPGKISYSLPSDLGREVIRFSEKARAQAVHSSQGNTPSPCFLSLVISWRHFLRETLGWFSGASCWPAAGRYQVWPTNKPAPEASALWSTARMSCFKASSQQLSPGYLEEVRELIYNHKTRSTHLWPTPGKPKPIFLWCRGSESIVPDLSQQELSALGL